MKLFLVGLCLIFGITPCIGGGSLIVGRDSTEFDVNQFVQHYYPIYGIDTAGGEPIISVWIETNGVFDQLDSLDISTIVRHGNAISTRIPLRLIPVIGKLASIKNLILGSRVSANEDMNSVPSFIFRGRGGLSAVMDQTACDLPAFALLFMQKYHKDGVSSGAYVFDTSLSFVAPLDTAAMIFLTDLAPGLYKINLNLGSVACPEVIVDSVIIYDDIISIIDLRKPMKDYLIRIDSDKTASDTLQLKWIEKYRDLK